MGRNVIEIDLDDLRRQVAELRLETEPERARPELRLGEIIFVMRRYVAAVVRANAPRRAAAGSEGTPEGRNLLLEHRRAHRDLTDASIGVRPLRDRLASLDCSSVIGEVPVHGLDYTEWEL